MALEKLEIYQTAFDLMVHIEECVRDFSRYFKYTVGSELRQMCSGILSKTAAFNDRKTTEKAAFCRELRGDIRQLQIKLDVCENLNCFKRYKAWYRAADYADNLLKQCERLHEYFAKNERQNQGGRSPQ